MYTDRLDKPRLNINVNCYCIKVAWRCIRTQEGVSKSFRTGRLEQEL